MRERGCAVILGGALLVLAALFAWLMFNVARTNMADHYPLTIEALSTFVLIPLIPAALGWLLISYGRRKPDV